MNQAKVVSQWNGDDRCEKMRHLVASFLVDATSICLKGVTRALPPSAGPCLEMKRICCVGELHKMKIKAECIPEPAHEKNRVDAIDELKCIVRMRAPLRDYSGQRTPHHHREQTQIKRRKVRV